MAKQKGRLFLLKVGDGGSPETFTTLASCKTKAVNGTGSAVEVTDDGSSGFKELLAGAGVSSLQISASGHWDASADQASLLTWMGDKSIHNFQMVDEDGSILQGAFQVTSFDKSGDATNAVQFSAKLESSGAWTIT